MGGSEQEGMLSVRGRASRGLHIARRFTAKGRDIYGMFSFESRHSEIREPDGTVVFSAEGIEVPSTWSQTATDILAQKYLRKSGVPQKDGSLGAEHSARQVAHRLAGCWRHWGEQNGYFAGEEDAQAFYDEIAYMLIAQMAAPNSPQWFNTGLHYAYGISGPAQGHWYVDPKSGKACVSDNAYERPQPHACFIQSVKDDLVNEGGIFDLVIREARLFKYGSGTGTNYSTIRGRGEPLSGGGTSSGLLSFLRVSDRAAGAIKSGGTTRRAAKMVCLDMDHPDIEEFILWKLLEEQKVASLVAGSKLITGTVGAVHRAALESSDVKSNAELATHLRTGLLQGIPPRLLLRALQLGEQAAPIGRMDSYDTDYRGEGFETVSGQNGNNSVRIPNSFFEAVEKDADWTLVRRTDGKPARSLPARKLWDDIGLAAWCCADPGIQCDTTINEWHTCPADGRINASNPCSEYMFLDDTACNLASLNVLSFYDDERGFDIAGYRHATRLWTIVLELSVLMAQFPSREIAEKSYQYRTLGLGYANIGTLLMVMGMPYDSEQGRAVCAALTSILCGESYAASAEMAEALGPFERFHANRESMLTVIRNHRRAAYNAGSYEGLSILPQALSEEHCPRELLEAARASWDRALALGEQHGYRNAQVTAIAPTGTIALVMDCDTTGIEPDFALVKYKKLAGGGTIKIVNQSVPRALRSLGYQPVAVEGMRRYCEERGTMEGSPHLKPEHLPVFDCASGARAISAEGHILMMAAAQPFVSGAISKTINMSESCTFQEVQAAYLRAWQLMLKGITIYRDNSKLSQPLSSTVAESVFNLPPQDAGTPLRARLPKKRRGFVQEATIGGNKVYLRTGEYPDGKLGEIFIDLYKEGASYRNLMNCFAISVSKALQYGVPLSEFVDSFTFTRFEPAGIVSGHPNVKAATSVLDYVFRVLGHEYLGRTDFLHVKPDDSTLQQTLPKEGPKPQSEALSTISSARSRGYVGEPCGLCGSMHVRRNGTCLLCEDCGSTSGCS